MMHVEKGEDRRIHRVFRGGKDGTEPCTYYYGARLACSFVWALQG